MTTTNDITDAGCLFIPRSYLTTESNKTGSWRFMRPRYDEKTAPCSAACPAGEDIGRIEMLASQGLFKEAWEAILMENPFPGVCGRVCFHPCESVCNRGELDQAIAIHMIERFLADTAGRYGLKPSPERRSAGKQKVAIVGAGSLDSAASSDISLGGLYLATDRSPASAKEIRIAFTLPGTSTRIEAKGRVAWMNTDQERKKPRLPIGFGLEFTEIDTDAIKAIRYYVDKQRTGG